MSDEELGRDKCGWKKGNLRKYTNQQKEEIRKIRHYIRYYQNMRVYNLDKTNFPVR